MIVSLILFLFLPLVDCRGTTNTETITKYASATGEFVEYSTSSRSRDISVRSSSIDDLKEVKMIEIRHFRGDGAGETLRQPSINSSTVYGSLFSRSALPAVFRDMDKGTMELALHVDSADMHKMKLTVKDVRKPFTIGNEKIAYFWEERRLPRWSNSTECMDYVTSSDHRVVSYCNVKEAERCAVPISVFPHLHPFLFSSKKGEILTHFAWLCPAGKLCCAWECCEKLTFTLTMAEKGAILSLLVTVSVMYILCDIWRCGCHFRKCFQCDRRDKGSYVVA